MNFRKVPVFISDLEKGKIIKELDVDYKRVESPSKQHKFLGYKELIGKELVENVKMDTEIKNL